MRQSDYLIYVEALNSAKGLVVVDERVPGRMLLEAIVEQITPEIFSVALDFLFGEKVLGKTVKAVNRERQSLVMAMKTSTTRSSTRMSSSLVCASFPSGSLPLHLHHLRQHVTIVIGPEYFGGPPGVSAPNI